MTDHVPKPRRIAVVGGTHGNEKGGVWAVKALQATPGKRLRPGLEVRTRIANPEAERRNLRYLDRDLNRCFGPELTRTDAPDSSARERAAARRISDDLRDTDLVIDLHNTTAAMGITWILTDRNPWVWWLAREAQAENPMVRILFTPETPETNVFLPSVGRGEITIEIGPVSHGTHSHWAARAALEQVEKILDRISAASDSFSPREALSRESFDFFLGEPAVSYPTDSTGEISMILHESLVGRDYHPLLPGAPLFVSPLSGEILHHQGEIVHPVFLGEAAYVEKNLAFTPTRPRPWNGGIEVFL